MIIVHSMGEFLLDPQPIHATDFLEKLGLSAHVLVSPNGDLYLCRDDDQVAWHAKGYNKDSLGIEFLVPGHHNYGSFIETIKSPWVKEEQWAAGVKAVRAWVEAYDIAPSRLLRHSDVSPGRKVDPGAGFDWERFTNQVYQ
jgi:N-acetyl-anhydromuramyl-L-alanine amidase AmpD